MEVLSPQDVERVASTAFAPGYSIVTISPSGTHEFAQGHFAGSDSPIITPHTMYDVASVTKLFTTALILRLHEAGRLSIYDPCSQYLQNFSGSNLRIIDLLTHRVGLLASLAEYRERYFDKESLLAALLAQAVPRQADNQVTYGSSQFVYLGIIAERVSGHDLQQQLHDLFDDLGLHETCTGTDVVREHLATPPTEVVDGTVVQGVTHDETARLFGGLAGHAGVFASAADVAKFGRAWLGDEIMHTAELKRAVFRDYDPSGLGPQAIGWWLRYPRFDGSVQATPGIFSQIGFTGPLLAINPAAGKVCAFTCNRTYFGRDNMEHRKVWALLMRWMADEHLEKPTAVERAVPA